MSKTKISRLASLFALVPLVSLGFDQTVFATGTQATNPIAGQSINQGASSLTLILSVVVLLITVIFSANALYNSILVYKVRRLSHQAVFSGFAQTITPVFVIFASGTFGVYLLLKL